MEYAPLGAKGSIFKAQAALDDLLLRLVEKRGGHVWTPVDTEDIYK
jgi:hypothetical protein